MAQTIMIMVMMNESRAINELLTRVETKTTRNATDLVGFFLFGFHHHELLFPCSGLCLTNHVDKVTFL